MIRELNINNFKTELILGNNSEEKCLRRPVVIKIGLRFEQSDSLGCPACFSDDLNDTICYAALTGMLSEKLEQSQFNLAERAAQYIYDEILDFIKKSGLAERATIRVVLIKPNPLGAENPESISFICSDW
jgi:FolB domain-containing protein